tara:strand:+ start:171 stop:515 length:345 start_codon:yes stop_codon:yes gene_type:complete
MSKILFIDNVGRTLLGEQVNKTETTVSVKNPVYIHVGQTAQGQLSVQLMPLFLLEMVDLTARQEGIIVEYNILNINPITTKIDSKLENQYNGMFGAMLQTSEPTSEPKIVKLFD